MSPSGMGGGPFMGGGNMRGDVRGVSNHGGDRLGGTITGSSGKKKTKMVVVFIVVDFFLQSSGDHEFTGMLKKVPPLIDLSSSSRACREQSQDLLNCPRPNRWTSFSLSPQSRRGSSPPPRRGYNRRSRSRSRSPRRDSRPYKRSRDDPTVERYV